MASYDIKDFDVYKYDVILRPDGPTTFNGDGTSILNPAASFPYNFDIPPNFFVFPNQKCYFHLQSLEIGNMDTATNVWSNNSLGGSVIGQETFLSIGGISSHFQRTNFGGPVAVATVHLPEHSQSALIRVPVKAYLKLPTAVPAASSAIVYGGAKLVDGSFDERVVCIPPPFGQRVDFQFKSQSIGTSTGGNNEVLYSPALKEIKMKQAVRMSFSILVEKKPFEKKPERY